MIGPPGSTPKRPRSAERRRPRAAWSRPPSARTPGGPTLGRCAVSTPGSTDARATTRRWPRISPSCSTTPGALRRAPRSPSPRRASARSSPGSLLPPASGRPGCSPGTGEPRPFGAEARRGRSGPRTWRPCSPPATGGGGADGASSPRKSPSERGRVDAVIAGLLFMAGMRRSEVSALRWADIVESTDGDGMLVTVRRSKTNQEGETNDVRFVKDGVARALRALRPPRVRNPATARCRCRRR